MTIQKILFEEASRRVHFSPRRNDYQYIFLVPGYFFREFQKAHLLGFLEYFSYVSWLDSIFFAFYTHSGMEYIQLAILVIVRVVTTLMAPFGMMELLRSVSCSTTYYTRLRTCSLGILKLVGRVPLSAHGFGSLTFSLVQHWVRLFSSGIFILL